MPSQQLDDLASVEEAAHALRRISRTDLLRLGEIARMRAIGLPSVDWEDLLNEALTRVLSGTRRWPRTVPFIAFLAQAIRSVAGDEWRRLARSHVTSDSDLASGEADDFTALSGELATDGIDPEREVVARATLQQIDDLFMDDAEAQHVLMGLAQGMEPAEVQTGSNMSATQYATAQKRIRRRLARHFSKDSSND
jgi:DNA-directed RNA polymerase specialized sigma24 family protein